MNNGSFVQPETVAAKLDAVNSLVADLPEQSVEHPRLAEMLWFVEWKRRQPGGMDRFAQELVQYAGKDILEPEFWQIPVDAAGRFSFQDALTVWHRLPTWARPSAPAELKDMVEFVTKSRVVDAKTAAEAGIPQEKAEAFRQWLTRDMCLKECTQAAPGRFHQNIVNYFFDRGGGFPKTLTNPRAPWEEYPLKPWGILNGLPDLLIRYMDEHAARVLKRIAATRVTRMVYDAMDYAWGANDLVNVLGDSRFGKTESLNAWCDAYPGRARKVRTPSSGGEKYLLIAIAEALGMQVGTGESQFKLKEKVLYVLRHGRLMLIFDESHFLVPANYSKTTAPNRLNLVRTEIVDAGLPCVMTTTPQSNKSLEIYAKKTQYAMEQWLGRVGQTFILPEDFTKEDMIEVARIKLPGISEKAIRLIVARAMQAAGFLHAMQSIAKMATFLAKKAGRTAPTPEDINEASDAFINGVSAPLGEKATNPASDADSRNTPPSNPSAERLQHNRTSAPERLQDRQEETEVPERNRTVEPLTVATEA